MVGGQKRVEHIPAEWVDTVQRQVAAGRAFQDAVREVLAANAQLLALARQQRHPGRRAAVESARGVLAGAFHAVEAPVHSRARRALGLRHRFGDDTLASFTERLAAAPLRAAIGRVVRAAKRRKAFDRVWLVGLALDGTTVGRCPTMRCPWCHPVIGPPLTPPGATGPVREVRGQPHTLSLVAVVRLKANVPTLFAAARARFEGTSPTLTITDGGDRVELWDADDFDPWAVLRWPAVRVIRFRQHHADGSVVEAYWLSDFSARRVSTRTLYHLANGPGRLRSRASMTGSRATGWTTSRITGPPASSSTGSWSA